MGVNKNGLKLERNEFPKFLRDLSLGGKKIFSVFETFFSFVQSTDMKIESSPNIVSNKSTFLKNFEIIFFRKQIFFVAKCVARRKRNLMSRVTKR
jgi:hypothetical protein